MVIDAKIVNGRLLSVWRDGHVYWLPYPPYQKTMLKSIDAITTEIGKAVSTKVDVM